ncbi:YbfB/YjiJ family MFS transporter [Fodinicola acaciae]|uniref:YbfB/YjiJ family MFS transporter n=1 Tax=Fodinicola acaciae TaxID=2681555 RepID=UPI0013D0C5F2|nr:YbfB/YjiJ family MFS transporter [Fodinicola acaciae]
MAVEECSSATKNQAGTLVLLVAGLTAASAAVNGLGRFAYALVLPAMRADLHWSYATAGLLNTVNALGYLAGALLAAPVAARLGQRRALLIALVVSAVAVLAAAATNLVPVLLVLRLTSGIAGAVAFIAGGALTAAITADLPPRRAALCLGLYFTGPGIGIAVSGVAVPPVVSAYGWQLAWVMLGVLCLAGLVLTVLAARQLPAAVASNRARGRMPFRPLVSLLVAYGIYGAGYTAYMTFVIAFITAAGARPPTITAFWLVLGLCGVGLSVAASPLLGRLRGRYAAALTLGFTTIGAALLVVVPGPLAWFASAVLFGGAFLSVVTAVTGCAQLVLPPSHWGRAIAGLTIAFAFGQCCGPLLAGLLSDRAGGVPAGLAIGAVLLAVSTVAALTHRTATYE